MLGSKRIWGLISGLLLLVLALGVRASEPRPALASLPSCIGIFDFTSSLQTCSIPTGTTAVTI
jgi:hypothetical protein